MEFKIEIVGDKPEAIKSKLEKAIIEALKKVRWADYIDQHTGQDGLDHELDNADSQPPPTVQID